MFFEYWDRFILLFLIFAHLLQAKGIEDAKTYHSNSALQWQIAMETIDSVPWKGSERVLDIGCGDGKITGLLATKLINGSVLGIDISQSMIDFASSHYSQANLTFKLQSAEEISFENQFDKIVSFSTLHWVLDQEKVLKAIYRALTPDGIALLHIYGKGIMNVTSIADRLVYAEKWIPYFPAYTKQRVFFTEQEYYALLEQAGFQQIKISGFWSDTPFSSRQDLISFVKPVLNFIRHLPENLQQEFVEEVVDQIVSIAGPVANGVIHYKTFNLQVIAVK